MALIDNWLATMQGTVTIENFYVENFGKLYRSCGNCQQQFTRHVKIKNVTAIHGKVIAGINIEPYNDTATIETLVAHEVSHICKKYRGHASGGFRGADKLKHPIVELGQGFDAEHCINVQTVQ